MSGDAPCPEPDPGIDAKLRFLMSGAALGAGADDAAHLIETHMSWVVVAGERVVKMKKPVRNRLLDFTTAAARERNCREELRLNRRLAPQVYLGLLAMQSHDGRLSLVPEERLPAPGVTIDWLVLMRRLPAGRMLDRVIATGQLLPADIDAVIEVLARFYRDAQRTHLSVDAYAARFGCEQRINREVLSKPRFAGLAADALLDRLDAALDGHAAALRARALDGKVVDGHGDLRPEHVCLIETPTIIDCLEFSVELRQIDPFDELAFLGLECRLAGAPWVARRLIDGVASVLDDRPSDGLIHLYTACRAALRARLAAAHLLDPKPRTPEKWLPLAQRYVANAASALDALAEFERAGGAV